MRRILVLLTVFVLCVVSGAAAQTVLVTGTTSRLDGGRYVPLGKIQIVVTRGNAVVTSGTSDPANGSFTLNVPVGPPFTIAFYGEQRVPELQQLAGAQLTKDNVNVTLLTPAEYTREFGGRLPLAQKLECDRRLLPEEAKDARAYMQQMINQQPGR